MNLVRLILVLSLDEICVGQTRERLPGRTAFEQAVARLHQGTGAAAAAMLTLMADPSTPTFVRPPAADCVFTIEARVAALEPVAELAIRQLNVRIKRIERNGFPRRRSKWEARWRISVVRCG